MSARAGIAVTGTEVLTGRVRDRNGPWLSDRLLELGVELAHVTICGDRPQDMQAQLRFMAAQELDLIVTTGGLGPTADDLTLQVVAEFAGRPLRLDEALEGRIAEILRPLMKRWPELDFDAVRASNRKQALVPEGATVIEPAGTAPGMVVPPLEGSGPTVVVMPGPPRELHAMWEQAARTDAFAHAVTGATRYEQSMLRLFGIPESEIAATLRVAEGEVDGLADLEVTTCLRRGEVEVVVRREPAAEGAWRALRDLIRARHHDTLFSDDGSSVDAQVAELLAGRTIALAESCTAGLMAARLAEQPGASGYLAGGVVSYADEAKVHQLGVDPALIERHGAVSPEVAAAMADGALERFGADVALAITGIAGPDGGTAEKPVGTVCWCARAVDGNSKDSASMPSPSRHSKDSASVPSPSRPALSRSLRLPGDRSEVRDRSTTVGMHMLRRLLRGQGEGEGEAA